MRLASPSRRRESCTPIRAAEQPTRAAAACRLPACRTRLPSPVTTPEVSCCAVGLLLAGTTGALLGPRGCHALTPPCSVGALATADALPPALMGASPEGFAPPAAADPGARPASPRHAWHAPGGSAVPASTVHLPLALRTPPTSQAPLPGAESAPSVAGRSSSFSADAAHTIAARALGTMCDAEVPVEGVGGFGGVMCASTAATGRWVPLRHALSRHRTSCDAPSVASASTKSRRSSRTEGRAFGSRCRHELTKRCSLTLKCDGSGSYNPRTIFITRAACNVSTSAWAAQKSVELRSAGKPGPRIALKDSR